jgi:hypothetical protein
MIASKNGFIIRFIDYKIGMEYRLLAPTFAWLWGTLLTILICCWIVRIRTIDWMNQHEEEHMDSIVATKLATRDSRIKELTRRVQILETEKQELVRVNRSVGVLISNAMTVMNNPTKTKSYFLKEESA